MSNQSIYAKARELSEMNDTELTELLLEDTYNNKGVLRMMIKQLAKELKNESERVDLYKERNIQLEKKLEKIEEIVELDDLLEM